MEKLLATKKQQLMSNYRFIVVSSSVTVLDCKMIVTLLNTVQDVVATLFNNRGNL